MMRAAAGILTASLLLAACSLGPAQPITTVALNVRDGAVEIPTDKALVLTLSRPAPPSAVASAFLVYPATEGTMEVEPGDRLFTWRPDHGWLELTEYSVLLTTFKDSSGQAVPGHRWSFLTTVVPRVLDIVDSAGTAVADGGGVDQGGSLKLTFNVPMDTGKTAFAGNGAALAATWSDDLRSATLALAAVPVGPLEVDLAHGRDALGHDAAAWKLKLDVSLVIPIHTTHLAAPALIQIPNDGYGARPQVGLQAADMVFEYLTEGNITRLTGLYTDVPDVVGPIRSGRRISFRLTRHYHGVLFLSGLSNDADHLLHADPVPAIFETTGPFYRDRGRVAPNNLFVSGPGVTYLAGGARLPDFAIGKGHPVLSGGDPGSAFDVAEHRSHYSYDPQTGTYGKVEDGQPIVDAGLGQPVKAFMVIVMHAHEFLVPDIESGCCTHGRDFDLDSGGAADVWYRGAHYAATWSAADRASPFTFKLADGNPLLLPKGMVWVDVVS